MLFFIRDMLANGSGFTFPAMVAPVLIEQMQWLPLRAGPAKVAAQVLVPAAMQIVTTPIHFLALSLYNNPHATLREHGAIVASSFGAAAGIRILKGVAAFGIGGLSNIYLRTQLGSLG